jgi:hypothetical protein
VRRVARLALGAFNDFIITAGSTYMGAVVVNGQVAEPTRGLVLMCLVTGLVGAARHVQALLRDLPKD